MLSLIVMLVNILLQDGRTNYIEGVLCTSSQSPSRSSSSLIRRPRLVLRSDCPLPDHRLGLFRI
jgi:hypothetical protein